MKKILLTLFVFLVAASMQLFAQEKVVTGKVTSYTDGSPMPGVSVVIKGTTKGTVTDVNGVYKLSVPEDAIIVFTFVGMTKEEFEVKDKTTIDLVMTEDIAKLSEVVITALGISREKKSLGYSTQQVDGELVNTVKSDNFMNSLSGKVAGVQIKKNTNMGGSTNIVLRGSKSLTNNNQVLFVIDGVPISNDITNTQSQTQGGAGYDYGNAASDINPDDIESISILKGSAATSLYGSRAGSGVVMIITKKGATKNKGWGVTLNSGFTMGIIDKSTFPTYQKDYGAGYGDYWTEVDHNGETQRWSNLADDASFGPKYDNSMVYQWNAVDPSSPYYQTKTPWKYADNDASTFFEKAKTYNTSLAIDKATEFGNIRLSYTKYFQNGIMPNSKLSKDNILLNGSWKITDKLTASGTANYIKSGATGRNSTGYSDNILTSFRQWYQTNVDMKQQKDYYMDTKRNLTWNYADPYDPQPIYWDNYYWTRYENYESDSRNRFIGNFALNYKINDWLDIYGRASGDSYNELQEERRAIGSIASPFGIGNGADGSLQRDDQGSGYLRRDITFSEYNYDLMLNFNRNISENVNLRGVLGSNTRRTNFTRLISATNGGLNYPGLYALQNSVDPLPLSKELDSKVGVNGLYANASAGFYDLVFIEGSIRRDKSSTLLTDNNVYYYPSLAGNLIFSNLMKEAKWLSFGKVRLNYAEVGNGTDYNRVLDYYDMMKPLNGQPITSVTGTKRNPDLVEERTKSLEGGLEMYFVDRRVGFDVALYNSRSIDQIMAVAVSTATGYTYKMVNAGEIKNTGVELMLNLVPVKYTNFRWDMTINWAKNKSEVVSLYEGVKNLQLGTYQGGITINARVGEPYGVICGTDYVYLNGQKVVDPETGYYEKTPTSDNVLGNINPDWTGGIQNAFSYKNWKFSFLIDCQKGGDIFSLDMYYGLETGLYDETSYINDLGNPVRNPIVYNVEGDPTSGYAPTSGGFINEGVNPDGTPNTTRSDAYNYGSFGYYSHPDVAFVYDASFVKLREVALSYSIPATKLKDYFIKGATFSLVGSNVWIIHKNLPYADPESGLGAGNLQGYSVGSLPSTRDFGFNLKLNF